MVLCGRLVMLPVTRETRMNPMTRWLVGRHPGLDRWTTTESGEFVAFIVVTDREDAHTAIEILLRGRTRDEAVGRLHSLGYDSIRLKDSRCQDPLRPIWSKPRGSADASQVHALLRSQWLHGQEGAK